MKPFQTRRVFARALICLAAFSAPCTAEASANQARPDVAQVNAFIKRVNPHLSQPTGRNYARAALAAAKAADIDPCLLLAVVSVESSWRANAVSIHGAIGLGQLKPTTAASLKADPYSVTQNLRATSEYLHSLLLRFVPGSSREPAASHFAIAAYNAGPGAMARAIANASTTAPESLSAGYVQRVVNVWQQARARFALGAPNDAPVVQVAVNAPKATLAAHPHLQRMIIASAHPITKLKAKALLVARVAQVFTLPKPAVAGATQLHTMLHRALAGSAPAAVVAMTTTTLQSTDEQTYWGMADTSGSIAHSLFSTTPDAPNLR